MGNSTSKVKDIGVITSVSPADYVSNDDSNRVTSSSSSTKTSNETTTTENNKEVSKSKNRSKMIPVTAIASPSSPSSPLTIPSSNNSSNNCNNSSNNSNDIALYQSEKVAKKIGKCEVTSIVGADLAVSLNHMYDANMMIAIEAVKDSIDQWNDVFISYNSESYELAKTVSDFLSQKGLNVAMPSDDLGDGLSHRELLAKSRVVVGIINNSYIESVYNDEAASTIKDDIASIEEVSAARTLLCVGIVDGPHYMDHQSCGDKLMHVFNNKSIRSSDDIYLDELFFRLMKGLKKSSKTITAQLSEINNHDDPDSKFLPIYLNLPDSFSFDDKYIVFSNFYKISSTSLVFYGYEKGNPKAAVVIKFMKNKADFDKEIKVRAIVDKQLFMSILEHYENHPHNVIFEQFGLGSFPHAIVMKKATKTLDSLILNEMGARSPDWDRIKPIALQIVRTLSRLHDRGIVLGNLDPTNIMCDEDNIKFIDLKSCAQNGVVCALFDSSAYMAPECFATTENGAVQVNKVVTNSSPSIDMWALGCVLYELFTCETLFHCGSNLSLVDVAQVTTFSNSVLKNKMKNVKNRKARDLLTLLLVKDPSGRTDIGHIFAHSFFTDNRALSNVLNHNEQYDVFLSYRNFSDYATADVIYKFLITAGFSVFIDKLYNSNMSWYENLSIGLKRSRVFVPLVSRAAIQNFEKIAPASPGDGLLIEYRIALEYKELNIIQDIVPVFIGDRDWSTGLCGNFFEQRCFPVFPDVVCNALEETVKGDLNISSVQPKSLKEICLSLFSLDSNSNVTDPTKCVMYRGDADSLDILKKKLITKVAKLEEKECNDLAGDILLKLKDLQSLGYIIKDKDGNILS